MSEGIQHLLKGGRESNRIGEARVDKIPTDRLNSIVERISGVNPSKIAAEVTGAKVETAPSPQAASAPQMPSGMAYGAGPAHDLMAARSGGDGAMVQRLANKVAMLEQQLAKHEVFNGNDNDVVLTSKKPAQGPSNRGPDSTVFARDIDPKKAKTKDPADGKPDKAKPAKTPPEGQMAGEHMNILGISMTEWREMAGIKKPPVDLTVAKPGMVEEFEDEVEGEPSTETVISTEVSEHQLWADFLSKFNTTPEDLAAFMEAAEENKDIEVLLAIQDLEDEFVESLAAHAPELDIDEAWAQWLEARELTVEMFDALVEAAGGSEDELEPLRALQSMFESEFKVGGTVTGTSVAAGGPKKATQGPQLPPKLLAAVKSKAMKPKDEAVDDDMDEDGTFECDSDESGGPNMKHPAWKKAMEKFKLDHKKSSGERRKS